jgi:hypothetical protein
MIGDPSPTVMSGCFGGNRLPALIALQKTLNEIGHDHSAATV